MTQINTLCMVGSPGTNKVMHGELSRLSRRALSRTAQVQTKHGTGVLQYSFDAELALIAIRYHRTSTRVLWGLFESQATRLEPLYDELVQDIAADRRPWLKLGSKFSVHASNVGRFSAGERQIVGTVKNAVIDGAKQQGVALRVDVQSPDWWLRIRMHDNTVWVGLDGIGKSLSQHGYRRERGAAPLREHLAAAMLMLSRYDSRNEVVIDPMCGSGTIPIEAALMATAAPRYQGECALDNIVSGEVVRTNAPLFSDTEPLVIGCDRDAATLRKAQHNADAAGVRDRITLQCCHFREFTRSRVEQTLGTRGFTTGLIIANPPYGRRLKSADTRAVYRELRQWTQQFSGWRAAFLVANRDFEEEFGRPRIKKPLKNASIPAYFYVYDL